MGQDTCNFGVVFCSRCGSLLVDSGFKSPSSLKCCTCGNTGKFKVGKIYSSWPDKEIKELLNKAVLDARIAKIREQYGRTDNYSRKEESYLKSSP